MIRRVQRASSCEGTARGSGSELRRNPNRPDGFVNWFVNWFMDVGCNISMRRLCSAFKLRQAVVVVRLIVQNPTAVGQIQIFPLCESSLLVD